MSKKFFKEFLFGSITKLLSTASPFSYKMVRYFQNPFEDYKLGATTLINREDLTHQIDEYLKNITKHLVPSRKTVDGGLYVGITGVAYMFYCLSQNSFLTDKKSVLLQKGVEYIKPALETSAGDKTSFLLGDAGTYAVAIVLYHEIGDEQSCELLKSFKSLYNSYLHPKFLKCGGDELFVGRAGYLAGVLWISRELKAEIFPKIDLYRICDMMVASGRDYSKKHKSPCPLMYQYYNTEYLGAAHGVSFILQMLMSVPGYLDHNKTACEEIKQTVEYIASLQTEEGNWPCCMEEIGLSDHKLVHWCHGAPGIIYLMAKAYLIFKDKRYYDSCIKAGEVVWQKGLLRKGPGICHGVAGNGYVFLLLYRLSGDEKYLYRAKMFADFLNSDEFIRDARLPDNPESLYEGIAGTVCFLSDILMPDKAEFPFQDVFSSYEF